jgi:hypothetical protein
LQTVNGLVFLAPARWLGLDYEVSVAAETGMQQVTVSFTFHEPFYVFVLCQKMLVTLFYG